MAFFAWKGVIVAGLGGGRFVVGGRVEGLLWGGFWVFFVGLFSGQDGWGL